MRASAGRFVEELEGTHQILVLPPYFSKCVLLYDYCKSHDDPSLRVSNRQVQLGESVLGTTASSCATQLER